LEVVAEINELFYFINQKKIEEYFISYPTMRLT